MMKEMIGIESYLRVRTKLRIQMNERNKMKAINSLAIPVVTYIFHNIN